MPYTPLEMFGYFSFVMFGYFPVGIPCDLIRFGINGALTLHMLAAKQQRSSSRTTSRHGTTGLTASLMSSSSRRTSSKGCTELPGRANQASHATARREAPRHWGRSPHPPLLARSVGDCELLPAQRELRVALEFVNGFLHVLLFGEDTEVSSSLDLQPRTIVLL